MFNGATSSIKSFLIFSFNSKLSIFNDLYSIVFLYNCSLWFIHNLHISRNTEIWDDVNNGSSPINNAYNHWYL